MRVGDSRFVRSESRFEDEVKLEHGILEGKAEDNDERLEGSM